MSWLPALVDKFEKLKSHRISCATPTINGDKIHKKKSRKKYSSFGLLPCYRRIDQPDSVHVEILPLWPSIQQAETQWSNLSGRICWREHSWQHSGICKTRPSILLHLISLLINKYETQINKDDTIAMILGENTERHPFSTTLQIKLKKPYFKKNVQTLRQFFFNSWRNGSNGCVKQNWYYYRKRWENDLTLHVNEGHGITQNEQKKNWSLLYSNFPCATQDGHYLT